jgi:hypothetical protein
MIKWDLWGKNLHNEIQNSPLTTNPLKTERRRCRKETDHWGPEKLEKGSTGGNKVLGEPITPEEYIHG